MANVVGLVWLMKLSTFFSIDLDLDLDDILDFDLVHDAILPRLSGRDSLTSTYKCTLTLTLTFTSPTPSASHSRSPSP